MISMAKELRDVEMGFRIEMDDFGTGYSSLGMLSNLPIDALKLDMSFVRNAFGENRDVRMIELIIDIADYLHVPVVAEGVETEEQYLVLRAMGCDYVQGYYFSRPVPPEDFDKFLIGRADTNYKITPSTKKAHMSISRALTTDFESIYYVDVASVEASSTTMTSKSSQVVTTSLRTCEQNCCEACARSICPSLRKQPARRA